MAADSSHPALATIQAVARAICTADPEATVLTGLLGIPRQAPLAQPGFTLIEPHETIFSDIQLVTGVDGLVRYVRLELATTPVLRASLLTTMFGNSVPGVRSNYQMPESLVFSYSEHGHICRIFADLAPGNEPDRAVSTLLLRNNGLA